MNSDLAQAHRAARQKLDALGSWRITGTRLDYRGSLRLAEGQVVTAEDKSQLAVMEELVRRGLAAMRDTILAGESVGSLFDPSND